MLDGREITVPAEVGDNILKAKTEIVTWREGEIVLKDIESIIPYEEEISNEFQPPKEFIRTEKVDAAKQMLVGFNKFIEENGCSDKTKHLLERAGKA
jgi:sulfate adenylyltransferase subunit 1 (EFTu-like GTPase family)